MNKSINKIGDNVSTFDSTDHYFKVDRRILNINAKAISKTALLIYLMHCRRINTKKNNGCSFSGFKDAKKYLAIIDKDLYTKRLTELELKHLITQRPDIKKGCLKSTPIEVLEFPEYDKKKKQFYQDTSKEHHHRTYNSFNKKYINVPSQIIDDKYLIDMSIEEIFALLWLYSECNMHEYLGVYYNFVHKHDCEKGFKYYGTKFGNGYSEKIYNKKCMNLNVPNKYQLPNIKFQGELQRAIENLIEKDLFNLVPILLNIDPEDQDRVKSISEFFRGLVDFSNDEQSKNLYLFADPGENKKVIWILRPKFKIKTKELELYLKDRETKYSKTKKIYDYYDIGTDLEEQEKILTEEFDDFSHFVINIKGCSEEIEDYFNCCINERNFEIYKNQLLEIIPKTIFRAYNNYKERML